MIDRVDLVELSLDLARPFSIARGTTRTLDARIVRVAIDGVVGWGEAHASPAVTGETHDEALDQLAALDPDQLDPDDIEGTLDALDTLGPAARAGVDLALHDLAGRRDGAPAHDLLGLPDGALPSAATITLTEPADAAKQARTWLGRGYTRLKVKVGETGGVLDLVDAVQAAIPPSVREPMPDPEIWVDANEALTYDEACALLPELAERDVALLEQPLPREDTDSLANLVEASPIPIFVDEAITSPKDVDALATIEGPLGVNVKVQKVGGLLAAARTVDAAREQDRDVLVGCNIETGLGIGAGACLTGIADHADLDGNLFLDRDPFPLARPMPGHVATPTGAGIGVHPDPRFDALSA